MQSDTASAVVMQGRKPAVTTRQERKDKMKNYIATYTEDNGQTYSTMTVSAQTFTKAYVAVMLNTDGIITELTEV